MATKDNDAEQKCLREIAKSATNPYCSFRDDRERRLALISRDVRIVLLRAFWLIAVGVVAFSGQSSPAASLLRR
ncbi:hypothetical protein SAMN05192543_11230 [Paraburkholderia megapolitana]|uniref:Uncharacterized protein n=1 Tax=Paraburkholderia megapolitana TaxID=420953 RepID=A0A1I3UTE3_9BURK|nr:hypothetical protein SAMN05192543_11230 [Paraburkholderia megapolitana]